MSLRTAVLTSLLALAALPGAAQAAATLQVTPGGSGTACSTAAPCGFAYGVTHGVAGDTVRVAAGTYSASSLVTQPGVHIVGAGARSTVLNAAILRSAALRLAPEATLTDLRIDAPGVNAGQNPPSSTDAGALLLDTGSSATRVDARAAGNACELAGTATLVDVLCDSTTTGDYAPAIRGYGLYVSTGNAVSATLTNVTVVGDARAVEFRSAGALVLRNSIVHARQPQACPLDVSGSGPFQTDGSSYPDVVAAGCAAGSGVTETGRIAGAPQFVNAVADAASADYRSAATSPTRDAGNPALTDGSPLDLGLAPRVLGGRVDAGAYEYLEPPTLTAGAPSGAMPTGLTLEAVVNTHGVPGTSVFSYGAGSREDDVRFDAVPVAGVTDDQALSQVLTGLTPNSPYTWKLCTTANVTTVCTAPVTVRTPAAPAVIQAAGTRVVAATGAALSAGVTPGNDAATVRFEYGTTTGYGSTSEAAVLPASADPSRVTLVLDGLSPATTYHARAVATNSATTTRGEDIAFTTPAAGTGSGSAAGGASPTVTTPATGAPVAGAPVSEAPATGAPVSGAPTTGAPVTGAPTGLAPVATAARAKVTATSQRRGVITVTVRLPAAGKVVASAAGYGRTAAVTATRGGLVKLVVRPTAAAAKALGRTGRRAVTITVVVTPAGAAPQRLSARVTVKR